MLLPDFRQTYLQVLIEEDIRKLIKESFLNISLSLS